LSSHLIEKREARTQHPDRICFRKLEYPNELMAEVGVSEANNAESPSRIPQQTLTFVVKESFMSDDAAPLARP
jgi:hypothetical protein